MRKTVWDALGSPLGVNVERADTACRTMAFSATNHALSPPRWVVICDSYAN